MSIIEPNLEMSYVEDQHKIGLNEMSRLKQGLLDRGLDFKNAIIAGGAPRDWALGVPARDIDIFYQVEDADFDLFKNHLGMRELTNHGYGYDNVLSVHEYSAKGHTCIQLIRTACDPEDYARSFPYNMSQCWIGEDRVFQYTHSFRFGFEHKILTETEEGNRDNRYVAKVLKRYSLRNFAYFPHGWEL